jgi:signal peptidase I
MVKRVIGVSGDTVTLSGSRVLINGNPLTEPYARWSKAHALESRSFTVPQGGLFVLGDNRDESADSRYWSEPFIEENRVIGPVAVVY